MTIISWVLIIGICLIVVISLIEFIRSEKFHSHTEMRESRFSAEIFYTLLVIYFIVIIGFGLIYFILSMNYVLLVENGNLRETSSLGSLFRSIYFSGVTLLTIGYGDVTPIGIGRFIALIQALLGYILPTAFVLKLVQSNQKYREKKRDML